MTQYTPPVAGEVYKQGRSTYEVVETVDLGSDTRCLLVLHRENTLAFVVDHNVLTRIRGQRKTISVTPKVIPHDFGDIVVDVSGRRLFYYGRGATKAVVADFELGNLESVDPEDIIATGDRLPAIGTVFETVPDWQERSRGWYPYILPRTPPPRFFRLMDIPRLNGHGSVRQTIDVVDMLTGHRERRPLGVLTLAVPVKKAPFQTTVRVKNAPFQTIVRVKSVHVGAYAATNKIAMGSPNG